jgi:large subunit ribosomal protein L20
MPRATGKVPGHRRRRKIVRQAKGYWGGKSRLYKTAKEAVERALRYSYRDRRQRKRDFRRLWILRINAAARQYGLTYATLIHLLKERNIQLNRKQLAELAVNDAEGFRKLVESVASPAATA